MKIILKLSQFRLFWENVGCFWFLIGFLNNVIHFDVSYEFRHITLLFILLSFTCVHSLLFLRWYVLKVSFFPLENQILLLILLFSVKIDFFLSLLRVYTLGLMNDMLAMNLRYTGVEMVIKFKGFMNEDILGLFLGRLYG